MRYLMSSFFWRYDGGTAAIEQLSVALSENASLSLKEWETLSTEKTYPGSHNQYATVVGYALFI